MPHSHLSFGGQTFRVADKEMVFLLAIVILMVGSDVVSSKGDIEGCFHVWRKPHNVECIGILGLELDDLMTPRRVSAFVECIDKIESYIESRFDVSDGLISSEDIQDVLGESGMGDYPMKDFSFGRFVLFAFQIKNFLLRGSLGQGQRM